MDNSNDTVTAKQLVDRGVNPSIATSLLNGVDSEAFKRTLEWYDDQAGRVGPGVLVAELRTGGRPPKPKPALEREKQYGFDVVDWLRLNFPEWNRDEGNRTHSAAIAAVLRLHHRYGKGNLTKREHGPEIREEVAKFEATMREIDVKSDAMMGEQ